MGIGRREYPERRRHYLLGVRVKHSVSQRPRRPELLVRRAGLRLPRTGPLEQVLGALRQVLGLIRLGPPMQAELVNACCLNAGGASAC